MEITEIYLSSRVTRQFGRLQNIPAHPPRPDPVKLCKGVRGYTKHHGDADFMWNQWMATFMVLPYRDVMGPLVTSPITVAPGYLDWFEQHSHLRVGNPAHAEEVQGDQVPDGGLSQVRNIFTHI